jgi:transcriptional regulator with XRE-family HTH domain
MVGGQTRGGMTRLGLAIAETLARLGVSRIEAGRRAGLNDSSYLSKVIYGRVPVGPLRLRRLADGLQVDQATLDGWLAAKAADDDEAHVQRGQQHARAVDLPGASEVASPDPGFRPAARGGGARADSLDRRGAAGLAPGGGHEPETARALLIALESLAGHVRELDARLRRLETRGAASRVAKPRAVRRGKTASPAPRWGVRARGRRGARPTVRRVIDRRGRWAVGAAPA